jgi:hypothetical protein
MAAAAAAGQAGPGHELRLGCPGRRPGTIWQQAELEPASDRPSPTSELSTDSDSEPAALTGTHC